MPRVDDDHADPPTTTSTGVDDAIGPYPVVRALGQGTNARVLECKDTVSPPPDRGRPVAVKLLHPAHGGDAAGRRRLQVEGEQQKAIASPYVARCFDVGEHDGRTFVVVELLSGESLGARLARDGALPMKEALRYARDAAKGLRAAAAAGVVHGDVRPANLFVDGRRLKVVDFGLAPPVAAATAPATPAGTVAFLAPELVAGGRADARSDLYSLGCTLFALLAGRPPFLAARVGDVLAAHGQQAPPSLAQFVPHAPPRVVALVDALLRKAPSQRPQSHDEAIALIETALEDVVTGATDLPLAAALADGAAPLVETGRSPPALRAEQALSAPVMDPVSAGGSAGAPAVVDGIVGAPTGVHGSLKQMNVVEIVQSLELGRKTATVDLQSTAGERGTFACDAGRVVFARTMTRNGEEAFYELVGHRAGVFRIHYGQAPPPANVDAPTQFLVLEALRRLDEGTSALDAPTVPTYVPVPASRPGGASGDDLPLVSADGVPVVSTEAPAVVSGVFDMRTTDEQISPFAPTLVRTVVAVASDDNRLPTVPLARPETATGPAAMTPGPARRDDESAEVARSAPRPATPGPDGRVTTATVGVARMDGQSRALSGVEPGHAAVARDERARRATAARTDAWQAMVDRVVTAVRARVGERACPPWLQATLRHPAAILLVALLVVAPFALVVVSLSSSDGAPTLARGLSRIDDGDAAAVLRELDAIPAVQRTPPQRLLRGHAIAALALPSPPPDAALGEWLAAARAKLVDDRALAGALARLRGDDAEPALDVLAAWPRPEVTTRLRGLLSDRDWTTRQHARMALSERNEFTDADADALGVLDLATATTCARRREALVMLGERGFSPEAVIAIERARTPRDDNACLLRDLPAAARAVAKRASAPRPVVR